MRKPMIYSKSMPGVEPVHGDPVSENILHEITRELAIKAMERQGDRAFDCPMPTAAIHEAGHAIIETSFGVQCLTREIGNHRAEFIEFVTANSPGEQVGELANFP